MTHGYISRLDQNVWQWFRNDNSETVPPFGVLRLTGVTTIFGRTVLTIDEPDTTQQQCYLINGPTAVRSGRYGQGTHGPTVVVSYKGTAPSSGDEWGPTAGTFDISVDGKGFCILGAFDTVNEYAEAVQIPVSDSSERLVYELYDNDLGQNVPLGSPRIIIADTIRQPNEIDDRHISWDLVAGTHVFNIAGWYWIVFAIAVEGDATKGGTVTKIQAQKDTGGGFSAITGTTVCVLFPDQAHLSSGELAMKQTATMTFQQHFAVNDGLQISASMSLGSDSMDLVDFNMTIMPVNAGFPS